MNTEDAVGWVAEEGADRDSNWRRGAKWGLLIFVFWVVCQFTPGRSHNYNVRIGQLTFLHVLRVFAQCIFTGGLLGHLGVLRDWAKSIALGCVVGLIFSVISLDLAQIVWGTIGGGFIGGCCYGCERDDLKKSLNWW